VFGALVKSQIAQINTNISYHFPIVIARSKATNNLIFVYGLNGLSGFARPASPSDRLIQSDKADKSQLVIGSLGIGHFN
jgi:hypothetical protein